MVKLVSTAFSALVLLVLFDSGFAHAGDRVWRSLGPQSEYVKALAIDPTATQTVYAGAEFSGVFKSTNGGDSWFPVNTGLTAPWIYALAIAPTTPHAIYAGTRHGVFKSTDGGSNWNKIGLNFEAVNALVIAPTNSRQ